MRCAPFLLRWCKTPGSSWACLVVSPLTCPQMTLLGLHNANKVCSLWTATKTRPDQLCSRSFQCPELSRLDKNARNTFLGTAHPSVLLQSDTTCFPITLPRLNAETRVRKVVKPWGGVRRHNPESVNFYNRGNKTK